VATQDIPVIADIQDTAGIQDTRVIQDGLDLLGTQVILVTRDTQE